MAFPDHMAGLSRPTSILLIWQTLTPARSAPPA